MSLDFKLDKLSMFNIKLTAFKQKMESCREHTLTEKYIHYDSEDHTIIQFINHMITEFYNAFCVSPYTFESGNPNSNWLDKGFNYCYNEVAEGIDTIGEYYMEFLQKYDREDYDTDAAADFIQAVQVDSMSFVKRYCIKEENTTVENHDRTWLREKLYDAVDDILDEYFNNCKG